MSEAPDAGALAVPTTAGGLLRQARQAQGLNIAALAAVMKVTTSKLESLEADRFDELPDPTFTRALAQAVCRALKVDSVPVLALLPPPNANRRLEQVAEGLNTPFRERPNRLAPKEWASLSSPAVWAPLLLLLAAGAIWLMPAGLLPLPTSSGPKPAPPAGSGMPSANAETSAPPVSAQAPLADSPVSEPLPVVQEAPDIAANSSAPATAASTALASVEPAASGERNAASAAAAVLAVPAAGAVQVDVSESSWVEVVDAGGKALLSRTLNAGETVTLDGSMPFKVKVGNVRATRMTWRGQPVNLKSYTRDNIARFELK